MAKDQSKQSLWNSLPPNWREVLFVSFSIAIGWAIYVSSDWIWWRKAVIWALADLAQLTSTPLVIQNFTVSLGGITSEIGRDCTYAQWVATALPMLWTFGFMRRVTVTLAVIMAIQMVNVVRIFIAMLATANGVPWFWAHDMPDYTIWYGSIAVLAVVWLNRHFSHMQTLKK